MVGVAFELAMTEFVLTLLIVVMVVVGTQPHGGFPLDRAAIKHPISLPSANREDAIRILVTRDGAIYFDHTEIHLDDIADQIRHKVQGGSEKRAYLMVDQRAHYGDVKPVYDAIRDGGVWNVSLITGVHEPHK
jgi:biopolymer transport protein ExbD